MADGDRCPICGEPQGSQWWPEMKKCGRCGQEGNELAGRGEGNTVMRLEGLANQPVGGPTGFEGEWLVAYDPRAAGEDPHGRPMLATIETTPDPEKALRFDGMLAARREWMRWDGQVRPDGKPSRPLLAFTVEIGHVDRAREKAATA